MLIRRSTVADAEAIAGVKIEGWRTAYRGLVADSVLDALALDEHAALWRQSLERDEQIVWVAEAESIVAFAASGAERTGQADYRGELYAIYILDRWRARGIGRRLFEHTVDSLVAAGYDTMLVWAFEQNPFRRFYEKLGGQLIGQQPIDIGPQRLIEVAYGWQDLAAWQNRANIPRGQ